MVDLNRSRRDEVVDLEMRGHAVRGCSLRGRLGDGVVVGRDCALTWIGVPMVGLKVSLGMRRLGRLEGRDSYRDSCRSEQQALGNYRSCSVECRYGGRFCSTLPSHMVRVIDDAEVEIADGTALVRALVEVMQAEANRRVEVGIARDSRENEQLVDHESCDTLENVYQIQSQQPACQGERRGWSDEKKQGMPRETLAQPYE